MPVGAVPVRVEEAIAPCAAGLVDDSVAAPVVDGPGSLLHAASVIAAPATTVNLPSL
jgi:hypothetical protein